MSLEQCIRYLIYIHAFIGGIALVSGSLPLIFKKGGRVHKTAGQLFRVSLVIAALLALIISISPGHENDFLFCIGVFSLYLTLSGISSLKFKTRKPKAFDYTLSGIMLLFSLLMLGQSAIIWYKIGRLHILFVVFGLIGLLLSGADFRNFSKPKSLKSRYMGMHIGKTTGAFIATFTAFLVTNQVLPPLVSWLAPTAIGVVFIFYWVRRCSR